MFEFVCIILGFFYYVVDGKNCSAMGEGMVAITL